MGWMGWMGWAGWDGLDGLDDPITMLGGTCYIQNRPYQGAYQATPRRVSDKSLAGRSEPSRLGAHLILYSTSTTIPTIHQRASASYLTIIILIIISYNLGGLVATTYLPPI